MTEPTAHPGRRLGVLFSAAYVLSSPGVWSVLSFLGPHRSQSRLELQTEYVCWGPVGRTDSYLILREYSSLCGTLSSVAF